MVLRTFTFRVPKKKEGAMLGFMRRPSTSPFDLAQGELGVKEALALLKRIPACRTAYFLRPEGGKGEYTWVTLWTSKAARERMMRRKEWQNFLKKETRLFAGNPRIRHYDVLLKT